MRTRDTALIRKLCGLGLPPQSLAQSLLPALREIIPAHSGGVFWVGPDAHMTALYAERLLEPEAMAAYYERHYKNAVEGFSAAFAKRARNDDPVSAHSFSPGEQNTAYFKEILRALDAYHVLYAILAQGSTAYAQLSLYRGAADKPFSQEDKNALRSLLRYVSSGLFDPDRSQATADESLVVEEGLGVVSLAAEIVSASDQWHRLVRLAALTHVTPSRAGEERRAIASFLREVTGGSDGAGSARCEEVVRVTSWGRFVVRKFPLRVAGSESGLLGLLVRREEPRTLALVRGAGHSALSPQQREVALLIAKGRSNPEIARDLGLALNTASYHVKQVFSTLEVSERNEVQRRLLELAPGGPPSRRSSAKDN